jgi:hypothetical protein
MFKYLHMAMMEKMKEETKNEVEVFSTIRSAPYLRPIYRKKEQK